MPVMRDYGIPDYNSNRQYIIQEIRNLEGISRLVTMYVYNRDDGIVNSDQFSFAAEPFLKARPSVLTGHCVSPWVSFFIKFVSIDEYVYITFSRSNELHFYICNVLQDKDKNSSFFF